jgi:hypothetical protein
MLPDITQQYEEKPFRYTRRPIQEDPPLEIIAECELCGVLIEDGQEVETYKEQTFCGKWHVEEYKLMEADGEL